MKKFKYTAAALAAAVLMTSAGCGKEPETVQQPSGITDQIEAEDISGDVSQEDTTKEKVTEGTSVAEATDGDAEPATRAADGTVDGTSDGAGVDVSIIMVGDLLMHDNISASGYLADGSVNYDHIFAHVKDDVQAADVAVINNEVIYGGDDRGYQNYPMFNVVTPVLISGTTSIPRSRCWESMNQAKMRQRYMSTRRTDSRSPCSTIHTA